MESLVAVLCRSSSTDSYAATFRVSRSGNDGRTHNNEAENLFTDFTGDLGTSTSVSYIDVKS